MGLTKHTNFSEEQNRLAAYAKALGHPARIAIIQHLLAQDACICTDLVKVLPLSQATVSQHLAELKKAGLIKGNIEGRSMCYCLDSENWQICLTALETLFKPIRLITKCC